MKLKINKEYEDLVPRLDADDYQTLKDSIQKSGIRNDLDVLDDGTILCGHSRFKIANELKIEKIPYRIVKIQGKYNIFEYIITDNIARRQMTTGQKLKAVNILQDIPKDMRPGRRSLVKIVGVSDSSISRANRIIAAEKNEPRKIMDLVYADKIPVKTITNNLDNYMALPREVKNMILDGKKDFKDTIVLKHKVENPIDHTEIKLSEDQQQVKDLKKSIEAFNIHNRQYVITEMKEPKAKKVYLAMLDEYIDSLLHWRREIEPNNIIDPKQLEE